jgi:hypothetical protein
MKKLIAAAIICIFCLASTGWATWYGTVYKDEVGQKNATVWTNPDDGLTTTGTGGGYSLGYPDGMVENTYYYWIKAKKDNYAGYNYVADYYHQAQPKTGLDIELSIYEPTPP